MIEKNLRLKGFAIFSCLLFLTCTAKGQTGENSCGDLRASYGPHDFRYDKDKLPIVTGAHFTAEVENLTRGTTSRLPGGDIAYTLRAIPNHPAALISIVRLGEKEKTDKPSGSTYTVECWLDRAIRFRPDDYIVRMIYAAFLGNKKRKEEAIQQLVMAKQHVGDNPFTFYNLGMIYADLGEYDSALEQAHIAYDLGIKNTGLRDRLKAAGKWRDPDSIEVAADEKQTETAVNAK